MERDEEASRFADIAAELAASDDLVPQVLCRGVRAKVLARRDVLDQAEQLAREAVAMVDSTDFPDLQALTLLGLAEVLESSGQQDESTELVERAQKLYEKKGNVVARRRIVQQVNTEGRL
jgi:ATP/maltotriose-dependent transcriptional regulator MalT